MPQETLQSVHLSALTISLVISMIIPILVGLATKANLSSGVKGLMTLVLNAIQTLIVVNTQSDGTALISKQTFIVFLMSLVVSIAMYAGVYKPLNVTSSTPDGKLGANTGIGSK
jgi:hypothetical protein